MSLAVVPQGPNNRLNLDGVDPNLTKPSSKQIHGRRFSNVAPVVASSVVLALGVGAFVSLFVIMGLVQKGVLHTNTALFKKIYLPIRLSAPFLLLIGGMLTVGTGIRCAINRSITKQLGNTEAREITAEDAKKFLINFRNSSYKRADFSVSEQAVLDQIKQAYQDAVKRELDVPHGEFVGMIGRRVMPDSNRSYIATYWAEHIALAGLHEGNHEFTEQQTANMTFLRTQLNIPAPAHVELEAV